MGSTMIAPSLEALAEVKVGCESRAPKMSGGSIRQLAAAMVRVQAAVQPAAKDAVNPHFKQRYADLANVWEVCRKPLADNGISVMQFPVFSGGLAGVTTVLIHSSGEWMENELLLPVSRQDPQGVGICITYARRYSLAAMLGVVADEDTDGADKGADRQKQQQGARPPAQPQQPKPPTSTGTSQVQPVQPAAPARHPATAGLFDIVQSFTALRKRMEAALTAAYVANGKPPKEAKKQAENMADIEYCTVLNHFHKKSSRDFDPKVPADVENARLCFLAMKKVCERLEMEQRQAEDARSMAAPNPNEGDAAEPKEAA